jgi:hypothetical protein
VFLGAVDESVDHRLGRTGLFFELRGRELLFVGGELARAATTGFVMQACWPLLFPVPAPGRHGVTIDMRGLSDGVDGCALVAEQETMGTDAGSA